jgi:hypothetical protein
VFQFCWLVKSGEFWFMFLGVAGKLNWREIRTFHLAQKLPHFEPNWRIFWRLNKLTSCSAKTD